jgi:hypothetical protein
MKDKTYGGLLKWDHQNKTIYVTRNLNPPSHNARFLYELKIKYPNYQIITEDSSTTGTRGVSTAPSMPYNNFS